MQSKKSPLEREWLKLEKQERAYLQKRMEKHESALTQVLEKKVPGNLRNTLDEAFAKAFRLVFEKGTGVIEKTYNRDELQKTFQINEYADRLRGTEKSLRTFSKKASGAGNVNLLLSGAAGMGLGALGIGLPVVKYAELKYRRRFFAGRMQRGE